MRFQDLFLILSQCVDLGLLSITATFRTARDLKKILGSRFEMSRISQCESPRVCGFMIKKGQSGDQIDDHNRERSGCGTHLGLLPRVMEFGLSKSSSRENPVGLPRDDATLLGNP